MRAGTDAQRGNGGMHGNLAGRMRRHALHDHSAGTRLRHGFHILYQGFLLSGGFPFDFISAFLQHLLRQEADMPYHGNAGIHNGTYLFRLGGSPLQLDGVRSGLEQPPCRLPGLLHRIIGMNGHISHQQGILHAARRGFHMVNHVVQRHMGGIRKPQKHHSHGIAYQHNIHAGLIQKAARRVVISSHQRHVPPVLAGADAFRFFKRLIHDVL